MSVLLALIRQGEKVDNQILEQPQAADGVAKPRSPGVEIKPHKPTIDTTVKNTGMRAHQIALPSCSGLCACMISSSAAAIPATEIAVTEKGGEPIGWFACTR